VQRVNWWTEQRITNQTQKLNTCSSIRPAIVVADTVNGLVNERSGHSSAMFAAPLSFATQRLPYISDRSVMALETINNGKLAEGQSTRLATYPSSGKHITKQLVSRPGEGRGGLAG